MTRLVREHYPVSNLPDDLREGLEGHPDVRVTIDLEPANPVSSETTQAGALSRFKAARRANFASGEEVDAYVRSLRDEWMPRER